MCSPPTAVIFDLDGTLVQTREASWQVFAPISRRHGLGIDAAEQFYQLFAENFFASLRAACPNADVADIVTSEFMTALDEYYSPAMVPGLIDVVKAMVPYSTLAVLSSNTTVVVRRVLRANDLHYCFAHVFGGDVEPDKAVGIARFLSDAASGSGRLCRAYYDEPPIADTIPDRAKTDPRAVVLITDTVGDVEAAVRSGIRAVGVAWGMHTEEQLLAAGAEFVAIWPQELLAHLYGRPDDHCPCATTQHAADRGTDSVVAAAARRRRERRRRGTERSDAVRTPPPSETDDGGALSGLLTDPVLAEAIIRTMR
ncbi:HAD family hydrolase [Williamsia sterculiae]|uniref:Phosphoglycolate phosphatase n=1 Tax=Williamsia sterculiae TaxID=1344003 RepID=A0A1N7DKL5_9NOCA|nr:HAD family hydrolase [Williamsia sterculiae]SIR76403.1 phosphoglycolate phosphatase [Williamsia sterculiae]